VLETKGKELNESRRRTTKLTSLLFVSSSSSYSYPFHLLPPLDFNLT